MLAMESQIFLDSLGAETVIYKSRVDEWVSPTGHNDPDNKWIEEAQAYDENVGTIAAHTNVNSGNWSKFLELTLTEAISCSAIRFNGDTRWGDITSIDVDVYYDVGWQHLYEGVFPDNEWVTKDLIVSKMVSKARVRFYAADIAYPGIYEFDFGKTYTERSIDAIVNRRQPAKTGGAPRGKSPLLEIKVDNDSTMGISSDEINLGQDLINLPVNIGESAQDRRITKILSMDSGMMKLEVR